MMNILFDLTASQPNVDWKYHGGGKYAKIVFLKLVNYASINSNISVYAIIDQTKFIDPIIKEAIGRNSIDVFDIASVSIEDIINQYKIDKFYTALPTNFEKIKKIKCQIIGAIHGLRGLETRITWDALLYERGFRWVKMLLKILFFNLYKKRQLKYFEELFKMKNFTFYVVSNHTKYSIKSFFPNISLDNIKVFYSPDVTTDNFNLTKGISGYFLMVSGNRWLKNNLTAAKALDQIISDYPEFNKKIIITGITDKSIYLKYLKNTSHFIFLSYVSEDELSNLYINAFALIYPTLNEGFGYPPLEAMRFRVPVIVSAITSIPEICGDSVLYTNPYSSDEIKNRILQLLWDENLYQDLRIKGLNRFIAIKEKQKQDLDSLVEYITT